MIVDRWTTAFWGLIYIFIGCSTAPIGELISNSTFSRSVHPNRAGW